MKVLQKSAKEDFIVLNFTDTQLTDGGAIHNEDNVKTILENTMQTLVSRVKPNLITVSGDLAVATHRDGYRVLADILDSFQIPWAFVWGNHDNEKGAKEIEKVVEEYLTRPYCLYERGDSRLGNGNYVIAIEEDGKIVEGLIMLDGHDTQPYVGEDGKEYSVWARLSMEQLAWYEEQVNALKRLGCTDTTVITHIPIYAYKEAFAVAFNEKLDKKAVTLAESYERNCWKEGYRESVGVCYEEISSYPTDDGVFEFIRKLDSTKTIICGHDHINNTIISYQGVRFVYGLKTGRGCYWHKDLNGGTVLRIGSEGVIDVYQEYVEVK